MTKQRFGAAMLAIAIAMLAVTWWGGWTVGQTQVFADDAPAAASVRVIQVYELTAGYYVVSGGAIVPFGVQPPNPPEPPEPPTPPTPPLPPVSDLSKAIVAEIGKVAVSDKRHEVAIKLSKTYEMLAGQTIAANQIVQACNAIVPLAVGSDAAVLAGVPPLVNAALAKCATEAAADAVLGEAAAAIQSTVPVSGDEASTAERYGFDWDKFMQFLMQLLTILLPIILKIPV